MKNSSRIIALILCIQFVACLLVGILVCRQHNIVEIDIEGEGTVVAELYPAAAPITVRNFKKHVRRGTYNGVIFHRIIDDFVVQAGDTGEEHKTIKGEFSENGVYNPLGHKKGVLSMARTDLPNSASTQFFICLTDERVRHLDGKYAAFGEVISGMEHVTAIGKVETNANGRPYDPPVITEARLLRGEHAPISGLGILLIVLGSLFFFSAVTVFFVGEANAKRRAAARSNMRNKKRARMTKR